MPLKSWSSKRSASPTTSSNSSFSCAQLPPLLPASSAFSKITSVARGDTCARDNAVWRRLAHRSHRILCFLFNPDRWSNVPRLWRLSHSKFDHVTLAGVSYFSCPSSSSCMKRCRDGDLRYCGGTEDCLPLRCSPPALIVALCTGLLGDFSVKLGDCGIHRLRHQRFGPNSTARSASSSSCASLASMSHPLEAVL